MSERGSVEPLVVTYTKPADALTLAAAQTAGWWGPRVDPLPDWQYTVTGPVGAPPRLTSVTPLSGPRAGGTTLTLTGVGLTGAGAVQVGLQQATAVTVVSDTSVTCVTPAGEGWRNTISILGPGGKSSVGQLYQYT